MEDLVQYFIGVKFRGVKWGNFEQVMKLLTLYSDRRLFSRYRRSPVTNSMPAINRPIILKRLPWWKAVFIWSTLLKILSSLSKIVVRITERTMCMVLILRWGREELKRNFQNTLDGGESQKVLQNLEDWPQLIWP